jgi:ketosteroid isomerase-like protein
VIIAVIAAAAVLAVAGVFGYKYFFARSDEDQIRALVATFEKDYNNADAGGLMTLVCSQPAVGLSASKSLGEAAFAQELRRHVDESGSAATSVANIHVTGDRAPAQLTTVWSKSSDNPSTETGPFVKENGTWKMCG